MVSRFWTGGVWRWGLQGPNTCIIARHNQCCLEPYGNHADFLGLHLHSVLRGPLGRRGAACATDGGTDGGCGRSRHEARSGCCVGEGGDRIALACRRAFFTLPGCLVVAWRAKSSQFLRPASGSADAIRRRLLEHPTWCPSRRIETRGIGPVHGLRGDRNGLSVVSRTPPP